MTPSSTLCTSPPPSRAWPLAHRNMKRACSNTAQPYCVLSISNRKLRHVDSLQGQREKAFPGKIKGLKAGLRSSPPGLWPSRQVTGDGGGMLRARPPPPQRITSKNTWFCFRSCHDHFISLLKPELWVKQWRSKDDTRWAPRSS